MLPHLHHPPLPIDLLDNEVSRIGVISRNALALEDPAVEPLPRDHSAPPTPGIRRHDVVVAPVLPSRPVRGADRSAERRVDLEEAVVVVARVVEAEAPVGVERGLEAREPVGVVGGLRSGVGVECLGGRLV